MERSDIRGPRRHPIPGFRRSNPGIDIDIATYFRLLAVYPPIYPP